jgi:NAD-dependent dihydropyrimidine dehydrogenase PreA subunit
MLKILTSKGWLKWSMQVYHKEYSLTPRPYSSNACLALTGCVAGAAGWPSNTLLYVGASASSVVSRSDPLVARCPLVVPVQGLQQDDEYLGVRGHGDGRMHQAGCKLCAVCVIVCPSRKALQTRGLFIAFSRSI